MADYTVKVHPDFVDRTTEGSMDTSILNGKSIQRTVHGVMVVNGQNRKMVGRLEDGQTFDDTIDIVKDYSDVKKEVSDVYILTDSAYVDYIEGTMGVSQEPNNMMALFDQVGISYDVISDINASSFADVPLNKKMIIPELEEADLLPDLSNDAQSVIETFVADGGTLVTFCPGNGDILNVLNEIFGFSLTDTGFDEPISLTEAGAALFPEESLTIPDLSDTDAIATDSMPEGSVTIYEGDGANETLVAQIPYGDGKIYIVGWDWYAAAPIGEEDGGWLHLLESILKS